MTSARAKLAKSRNELTDFRVTFFSRLPMPTSTWIGPYLSEMEIKDEPGAPLEWKELNTSRLWTGLSKRSIGPRVSRLRLRPFKLIFHRQLPNLRHFLHTEGRTHF